MNGLEEAIRKEIFIWEDKVSKYREGIFSMEEFDKLNIQRIELIQKFLSLCQPRKLSEEKIANLLSDKNGVRFCYSDYIPDYIIGDLNNLIAEGKDVWEGQMKTKEWFYFCRDCEKLYSNKECVLSLDGEHHCPKCNLILEGVREDIATLGYVRILLNHIAREEYLNAEAKHFIGIFLSWLNCLPDPVGDR